MSGNSNIDKLKTSLLSHNSGICHPDCYTSDCNSINSMIKQCSNCKNIPNSNGISPKCYNGSLLYNENISSM